MRQIGSELKSLFSFLFSKRTIIHIPHGLTVYWFGLIPVVIDSQLLPFGVALALIWSVAFLIYELNSDRHKSDGAWRDIYGFLVGLLLGGILIVLFAGEIRSLF